jgi:hypothetical protein
LKKIGFGTVSFLLVIFAIIWSFSFGLNGFCLGDIILSFLGMSAWSNGNSGTHYTIFYSLIFLLPAVPLSFKYESDLFAKIAKWISTIFSLVLLVGLIFMVI